MKPTPLKHLVSLLQLDCTMNPVVFGYSIDSRKIDKGDLYFALSGNRVDGHSFLEEVAQKGAVAAVVKSDYRGDDFGLALIYVPDVLDALQELAKVVLPQRNVKVVAITGSLGKTTTKEFTADLLSSHFRVARTPLSYNSQATLPLSILKFSEEIDIYVLEMGMSERGEIAKLVAIAPPDIAVITTVSAQHTSSFSDGIAGVAFEKGTLFSHPKTTLGILNYDMPCFENIVERGSCTKTTFSCNSSYGDYYLEWIEGKVVVTTDENEKITFPPFLTFKPHYQNFLAAAITAAKLGVSWKKIVEIAPTLKLPPMRFERVEKEGVIFINDAYNANPEATAAALAHLPNPKEGGKKIALLSEMNALGKDTEEGHALVARSALANVDQVLCIGKQCLVIKELFDRHQKPAALYENKEVLFTALKECVEVGDVVLIKGARAYALEELLAKF